jgi:hypothetical protein
MRQQLRRWYYVGTVELWNEQPVDVYEDSTADQIRLCDGRGDEVFCGFDELEWLIDVLVRAVWMWRVREPKQVTLWV